MKKRLLLLGCFTALIVAFLVVQLTNPSVPVETTLSATASEPPAPSTLPDLRLVADAAEEIDSDESATPAWNLPWAATYPRAVALPAEDPDHDGVSNYDEMLAGTNPYDNVPQPPPEPQSVVLQNQTITTPSETQTREILRSSAAEYFAHASQRRQAFLQRAATLGLPLVVPNPGGSSGHLFEIMEDGSPVYLGANSVAAADTVGVDELWPVNSVTVFPGWPTGSSGLALSGSGVVLGMWETPKGITNDAGVLTTHDQFSDGGGGSRVSQLDLDLPEPGPHATGVAGVLASAGASAFLDLGGGVFFNMGNHSRGMAFAATVHAYDTIDLAGEFDIEASEGLSLSNHSYSPIRGWQQDGSSWVWWGPTSTAFQEDWWFGAYLGTSGGMAPTGIAPRELDARAAQAPYTLMTILSGNFQGIGPGGPVTYVNAGSTVPQTATRDWNNGDDGGYDSLPPSACAKNALTVGACFDIAGGYTTPSSVVPASFSSSGPCDDGRIKPEIVAPGIRAPSGPRNPFGLQTFITPGFDANNPSSNSTYFFGFGGTSVSAPIVTGGLGLVLQRRMQVRPEWVNNGYPVRSSTWRALAIHTANDAGPNPGPDFKTGYGLFNALAAVNLMQADIASGTDPAGNGPKPFIKEVLLKQGAAVQFKIHAVASTTPLKVTIAWTDPQGPATANNVLDPTVARLVNDLDVRIYPPGTTTFDPAAVTTAKPWVLNPDLTGKVAAVRASAATTGDDARNNLEQVVINNPVTTGDYIVRVTHKGSLNGQQQWVSILASGNTIIPANPIVAQIAQFPPGSGTFIISWNAVVGGIYQLQKTTDFFNWVNVSGDLSANVESMSTLVTAVDPFAFFRFKRVY